MNRLQIKAIIAAYEFGLATAAQSVPLNPYPPDSDTYVAWSIGRKTAQQLAECEPRVPHFVESQWPAVSDEGGSL